MRIPFGAGTTHRDIGTDSACDLVHSTKVKKVVSPLDISWWDLTNISGRLGGLGVGLCVLLVNL